MKRRRKGEVREGRAYFVPCDGQTDRSGYLHLRKIASFPDLSPLPHTGTSLGTRLSKKEGWSEGGRAYLVLSED